MTFFATMDRIPYVCSVCHGVTYAPPGLTCVYCPECRCPDRGTELARARWAGVVEAINGPRAVAREIVAGALPAREMRDEDTERLPDERAWRAVRAGLVLVVVAGLAFFGYALAVTL